MTTDYNSIQRSLLESYRTSATAVRPPLRILEELKAGHLVISDIEVGEDEVHALCKFLSSKQALSNITMLELNRSTGVGSFRHHRCFLGKHPGASPQSAFLYSDKKLLRSLFEFVSKAKRLHSVLIDSIPIPGSLFPVFAHCLRTAEALRWLSFTNVAVGNEGLRSLTHCLSGLHLQVLIFDRCGLSDESCNYLATVIKTQEAMLDNCYWNSSLRASPSEHTKTQTMEQTYYQGLLVLSVRGNSIRGPGLATLGRVLSSSYWLLGLDLAGNKIDKASMTLFANLMSLNHFFRIVLAYGNPGYSGIIDSQLNQLAENQISDRFRHVPSSIVALLQRWVHMQAKYGVPVHGSVVSEYEHGDVPGFTEGNAEFQAAERVKPSNVRDLEAEALVSMHGKLLSAADRVMNPSSDDDGDLDLHSGRQSEDDLGKDLNESRPNRSIGHRYAGTEHDEDADRVNLNTDISLITDDGPLRPSSIRDSFDGADNRPQSRQSLRPRYINSSNSAPYIDGKLIAKSSQSSQSLMRPRSAPVRQLSNSMNALNLSSVSAGSGLSGHNSRARYNSVPKSSSPSVPTVDRSEFLVTSLDRNVARSRIWSPSGHESRLPMNKRAGEALQSTLSEHQTRRVLKSQERYYDEATSPSSEEAPALKKASKRGKKASAGGKKATSRLHNPIQQPRSTRQPGNVGSHKTHTEVPARTTSPTVISQDRKPRHPSPRVRQSPEIYSGNSGRVQSSKIHHTPSRKGSKSVAKSPVSPEQLMASMSEDIARTMLAFTKNVESVSARLIAVCEGFTETMQQVASNVSHLADTSMNASLVGKSPASARKIDKQTTSPAQYFQPELGTTEQSALIEQVPVATHRPPSEVVQSVREIKSDELSNEFSDAAIENALRESLRHKLRVLYSAE